MGKESMKHDFSSEGMNVPKDKGEEKTHYRNSKSATQGWKCSRCWTAHTPGCKSVLRLQCSLAMLGYSVFSIVKWETEFIEVADCWEEGREEIKKHL
jgi:hypothetical protein